MKMITENIDVYDTTPELIESHGGTPADCRFIA